MRNTCASYFWFKESLSWKNRQALRSRILQLAQQHVVFDRKFIGNGHYLLFIIYFAFLVEQLCGMVGSNMSQISANYAPLDKSLDFWALILLSGPRLGLNIYRTKPKMHMKMFWWKYFANYGMLHTCQLWFAYLRYVLSGQTRKLCDPWC